MAVQCYAGNTAAVWSGISPQRRTGIGKAINGSTAWHWTAANALIIIKSAIAWDTISGVARHATGRNEHAIETAISTIVSTKGTTSPFRT